MAATADIRAVAEAHRAALLAADRELPNDAIERRLLHALVADSLTRAQEFVVTRVPNGDTAAGPLRELTREVADRDAIGKAVRALDDELFRRAKGIVTTLLVSGTWPLWLGAVTGLVVGFLGFAHEGGFHVGVAVWGLVITGGTAAVNVLRYGGPLAAKAAGALRTTALGTFQAVDALGSAAERLYAAHAQPAVAALYQAYGVPPARPTVLTRLRTYARTVVFLAWGALAFAGLVAAVGLWDGLTSAATTPAPVPTFHYP
ncbi:MAG TPA: hypothetical protein VF519_03875 [Mycobacteriales bacterium]|jgi:hypothetical protein